MHGHVAAAASMSTGCRNGLLTLISSLPNRHGGRRPAPLMRLCCQRALRSLREVRFLPRHPRSPMPAGIACSEHKSRALLVTHVWSAEMIRDVTTRTGAEFRLRHGYQMGAPPTDSKFTFDAECEARLNAVLQEFEGVHNFHNFTPAVLAEQMSAQRCAPPRGRLLPLYYR